jgi:fructokinase
MPLFGAIEAGGTKFLCALGENPAEPRDILRIATSKTNPLDTMREVIRYFEDRETVAAIGIASFGPLRLREGRIGATPKDAWKEYPIQQAVEWGLGLPTVLETDVNAAAVGEAVAGAGLGIDDFAYVTVGTGIGVGIVTNGRLVHGTGHPEMGHIPVERHPKDEFAGCCPYHGACLEGLASGEAMNARWSVRAEDLPQFHEGWTIEAFYLSQLCRSLAYGTAPKKVLLGGSVATSPGLPAAVADETTRRMNGYGVVPEIEAPKLAYPALTGALELARRRHGK